MIVVIDTNVWISGLQFSSIGSTPGRALERAGTQDTVAISDDLEAEIYRILIVKFQWPPRKVREALDVVLKKFVRVALQHDVHICRDPKDNMFLECAALSPPRASSRPRSISIFPPDRSRARAATGHQGPDADFLSQVTRMCSSSRVSSSMLVGTDTNVAKAPMNSAVLEQASADDITRAIFEHATRIGRVQHTDDLVRLNADFARDLLGADRCSLWLIDKPAGELWTKLAHGVDEIRIPLGKGVVGACIDEDAPLLVNDTRAEPRLLRRVDESSGYRTESILCVPLRAEGRVIGAFQVLNKPGGFSEGDIGLLGLLAHFAAEAIEGERLRREAMGAKLLRHELKLAHDVQNRMLPENPTGIDGLECVGCCRPARSIGGDYYDLLPLRQGGFAVTLGDVSGKGIPAAVMMASIQTLLRSLLQREDDLAVLLSDLNRTLYSSTTAERYSTLFCGVISPDRRSLTYVNAGHVQPLLLHADGELERLPGDGLPIALLPEATYEQTTVALRPGDLLVVVSDGIVEACNAAGEFWEEEEVERVVLAHVECATHGLPGALCSAVDDFAAGAEQYDDMTVVAVRIL